MTIAEAGDQSKQIEEILSWFIISLPNYNKDTIVKYEVSATNSDDEDTYVSYPVEHYLFEHIIFSIIGWKDYKDKLKVISDILMNKFNISDILCSIEDGVINSTLRYEVKDITEHEILYSGIRLKEWVENANRI